MTKDEIRLVKQLREEGVSVFDIAERMGYAPDTVRYALANPERSLKQEIIFPRLRNFIIENCESSVSRFAKLCDISGSTMVSILDGSHDVMKKNIDKILCATGMSYEDAFEREDVHGEL